MTANATTALLSVSNARKRFGAVTALAGVSLDLHRGEILALLGDNGAGKTTLIKALSGVHQLDAGQIAIDGEPVDFRTPHDARAVVAEQREDLALMDVERHPGERRDCAEALARVAHREQGRRAHSSCAPCSARSRSSR